jgi:hypothetical protein
MQVQLYDCLDKPDRFLLPVRGTAPIRIAGNESFCLDAPGGSQLQFWTCKEAPEMNVMFESDPQGQGRYRLRDRGMCMDVPNGDDAPGNFLQMWPCASAGVNMRFSVHAPVDCEWSEWEDWGKCSEPCGGGHTIRARRKIHGLHLRRANTQEHIFYGLKTMNKPLFGGKKCTGETNDMKPCGTAKCKGVKTSHKTWLWG